VCDSSVQLVVLIMVETRVDSNLTNVRHENISIFISFILLYFVPNPHVVGQNNYEY
jgi:hypothetical protein